MQPTRFSLASVAAEPELVAQTIVLPGGEPIVYRALLPTDAGALAEFLGSLSQQTRRYWDMASYDLTAAQELCDAIARYDKFRMVAVSGKEEAEPAILALFELAFNLGTDQERYEGYGVSLPEGETCRFGPCIRDSYQNRGLGSALMPPTFEIARGFGQQRIILWGGVLQENERAIHFYRRHGFQLAGTFHEQNGLPSYDMYRSL